MSDIVFTAQPTPNPNAYKFVADRKLHDGAAKSYYGAAAAASDPAAARLFAIPGVAGVMIVGDFCSVTKEKGADWNQLLPQIIGVLAEVF